MNGIPSTAVILAAGLGLRYGSAGKLQPKGFMDFGDGPIIELSIAQILSAGIQDILIVTGHLAEQYQQLAAAYPGIIRLVFNPDYESSGSMYSLACARDAIRDDFWLFESDLVYERRALEVLAAQTTANVVLLSGQTNSQDEVYAEAPNGLLYNLSKARMEIRDLAGELVGICRISAECYRLMLKYADDVFLESFRLEYEQALVAAARQLPVHCPLIADLAWSEIDTVEHWRRVNELVYPLIRIRDSKDSI